MPSLKLSNPFRRGAKRLSMKEQAASLRETAARVVGGAKPEALAEAGTITAPAAEIGEAHPDAALLSLETEFITSHRAVLEASEAHDAAYKKLDEPEMPGELRVWQNDWLYNSIPRPRTIPLADGTALRLSYGPREIETLRASPCLCVVVGGTQGEPRQGGGRTVPDPAAQARADAIVAAWDRWQAEIRERKEELNLFDLLSEMCAAEDRRQDILRRVLSIAAQSLAGLGVKARVAFALSSGLNPKEAGARSYDADEFEAFVFDLAGDALVVAGDASVANAATASTTNPTTAPAYDLSGCTLPQLARLYETWDCVFHHLTAACAIPCFTDSRHTGFTPAGEVLDREYDRAGEFLGVIECEARKRIPESSADRDERLSVLVRHEINTNGRPAGAALLSELNAAIEA